MKIYAFLLAMLFGVVAYATAPAILEARQQVLDGKRADAIQTLHAAMQQERNSARSGELQKELTHIAGLFLTNESQKEFEIAESSRHSGRPGFLPQYEEALTKEPQNTRIMMGYLLGLIASKNCKKAFQVATQIEDIDAGMPELKYLRFRAQICTDPSGIGPKREAEIDGDKTYALYDRTARAQEQMAMNKPEGALTSAREAMQIDDKFPQAYYWAFKAQAKDNMGLDEAQRFLYLCKAISAETRLHYTLEPELCAQTDEVEEFIRDEEAGKHDAK